MHLTILKIDGDQEDKSFCETAGGPKALTQNLVTANKLCDRSNFDEDGIVYDKCTSADYACNKLLFHVSAY